LKQKTITKPKGGVV